MVRDRHDILRGALVAAVLSGAPSSAWAVVRGRSPLRQGLAATRAIGVIAPPGRPGLARGALVHGAVSLGVGGVLGVTLPRSRSVLWGGLAGLGVGVVALRVVAPRRFPAVAALPLGPQLADNVAFGMAFAWVADRRGQSRPAAAKIRS